MIRGLAHVCYTVRDIEKSVDFYQNQLGLGHAFDFINAEGKRHGVYLKAGQRSFIELFEGAHDDRSDKQSYRHICLEVDDIEVTVAELRSRGIEVGPITLGGDRSWQAWLEDPDGNRIELHCYTPESKQLNC